jgi:hypothetical protein
LEFFKPVFDGIRERLKKHSAEDALMLGIGHDVIPGKECVDMLAEASGGAKWVMHCHPQRWSIYGQRIGFLAHVWGTHGPTLDPKRRRYGWKEKRYYTTFPRAGSGTVGKIHDGSPLLQYRAALESAICAGIRGYGWIGADWWPVVKDKRGRMHRVCRDTAYDRRGQLGLGHTFTGILRPGSRGPVSSVRLEMVREGAQETEARVYLERALADKAKREKFGEDLVSRCREHLDRRLGDVLTARGYWDTLVWRHWERQKGELFTLAAEAAAALE